MKVQLLSFPGCPNVEQTRDLVTQCFLDLGISPAFEEIDVTSPGTPEQLRGWGSPTVLIDGKDLTGQRKPAGSSCRLYGTGPGGVQGVPSEDLLRSALRRGARKPRRWLGSLAAAPGAILPLLPSAACPACAAAYAGVLSSIGAGFLLTERWLAPIVGVFLVANLFSVGWSTRSHRRAGPLLATVVGSVAVVAGRLVWNLHALTYGGVALLIAASLWNLWLKRPRPAPLVQLHSLRKGELK